MNTTAELIKVDAFKQIIDTAPDSLAKNQISANSAETYGINLLAKVTSEGMTDELDKQLNDYQVKLKKTYELMNDRRTPITKIFDDVKKAFTSLEAKIDPKSKENIYFKIQAERNKWAEKKAKEAAEKAKEAERKIAVEKERIEAQTQIESQLQMYFNNHLSSLKQSINSEFERMTLETAEAFKKKISGYTPAYNFNHFELFKANVFTNYLTSEELNNVLINVKAGKFDQFALDFKTQLTDLKTSAIEKIPSKVKELTEISNANEVEKARLQKEAAERKALEEARLQKESAERNAKALQDAETAKNVMTANTLFDLQGTVAENTASVREGYEIEVLHPSGYQLIVAFYFEKEGLKETPEKLGNMKLSSMKTFCEKWAKDKDEKIQSIYLRYKETYKATARK